MKRLIISFALLITMLLPVTLFAGQRHRVVVRRPVTAHRTVVVRRPAVHTTLVVHRGHPVRRVLPASVVVHPARRNVLVAAPLVYLPALTWRRAVVVLPARERLVWEDSESIELDEGWVDTNFGVDNSGDALFLDINGAARLNFAEITFANGNVQVVDFNEQTHNTGLYQLLDFADGRHVKTVRMLAKSETDKTTLAVYLSK